MFVSLPIDKPNRSLLTFHDGWQPLTMINNPGRGDLISSARNGATLFSSLERGGGTPVWEHAPASASRHLVFSR